MLENATVIVEVIKVIIMVVGIIATAFATKYGVKNKRLKKHAENAIAVGNYVQKFIIEAEKLIGFLGSMKKKWVQNEVHGVCLQKGIPYDRENVDKLIEEKVEMTKIVNPRPIEQPKELEPKSDIYK